MTSYSLLDSGEGWKFEQFGLYSIIRPSAQAVWGKRLSSALWEKADAFFTRQESSQWQSRTHLPQEWTLSIDHLVFKLSCTDFGHLGIFPEQRPFWRWIQSTLLEEKKKREEPIRVLNLFAYSGGSTLAAAKGGASVCHLDASKGMVNWARENAALNGLEKAPIRWIVDDVMKFLLRELRRGNRYDAIILDPPTFGRGSQGELFKIEEQIRPLLSSCRELLSTSPLFILFSCHTPGFTPLVMSHLMEEMMGEEDWGKIDCGEMCLEGDSGVLPLPSGTFARWVPHL